MLQCLLWQPCIYLYRVRFLPEQRSAVCSAASSLMPLWEVRQPGRQALPEDRCDGLDTCGRGGMITENTLQHTA